MSERIQHAAALANRSFYDATMTGKYALAAPHLRHASLRVLYSQLVVDVFDYARVHAAVPSVLDLGAGEGSVTLPFLELGARVTAVDISQSQLDELSRKCRPFGDRLQLRCEDITTVIQDRSKKYDIVTVNSFLHHVPDYLAMIRSTTEVLSPHGQFFSFQDPLRYDSLGRGTRFFAGLAYLSWRLWQGDVWAGLQRRFRRSRGIYLDNVAHDTAEYHAVRNGVDQQGIQDWLRGQGFDCAITAYFSTQSRLFQRLGQILRLQNTFAVIARRRAVPVAVA